MKKEYFKPILVKDVKLHSDFALSDPMATAIHVSNIRMEQRLPVVTCTNLAMFKEDTGYEHTPELYIRSRIMLDDGFKYDARVLDWRIDNAACKKAVEADKLIKDYGMTFEYDDADLIVPAVNKYYSFRLPEELFLLLPIDLNESQYIGLEEHHDIYQEFIKHLAWRQMMCTLPIFDIKEI